MGREGLGHLCFLFLPLGLSLSLHPHTLPCSWIPIYLFLFRAPAGRMEIAPIPSHLGSCLGFVSLFYGLIP